MVSLLPSKDEEVDLSNLQPGKIVRNSELTHYGNGSTAMIHNPNGSYYSSKIGPITNVIERHSSALTITGEHNR
jgi:hypothetical protein